MPHLDLTGQRFGRLVVAEIRVPRVGPHTQWNCDCDCGRKTAATTGHLRSGHTQSCGCLQRARARKAATKHGKCYTPMYVIWAGIRQRCRDTGCPAYRYYGGRGIRVCERWLNSVDAFIADMGPRPSARHSVDRIDNDGDYTPENCRWATDEVQNRDKRGAKNHNARVTADIVRAIRASDRPPKELAAKYGIDPSNVSYITRRKTWRPV